MTDECALSPEAKTLQWNEKNLGNIFMITLNGSEGADALVKKGMHLQQLCSDYDTILLRRQNNIIIPIHGWSWRP